MDFLRALELAVNVIRDGHKELDEIYLYEPSKQVQVYLKDCEGSLQFMCDEPLPEQIFLASCLDKRLRGTSLSLEVIFSASWEVRLRKNQHLKATMERLGKKGEFIDYTPVGKEEVADV